MNLKFCPACGERNNSQFTHCWNCSSDLSGPQRTQEEQNQLRTDLKIESVAKAGLWAPLNSWNILVWGGTLLSILFAVFLPWLLLFGLAVSAIVIPIWCIKVAWDKQQKDSKELKEDPK